jgi:pimeloyl-ACP methyl ester carboxylesterase
MESVEVDGLRIAYERAGTGPPLVLLHGYVGDGPTTWRFQLDALAGFIARLGLASPHVAGLSFGGILALALAGRHPAVPRTLVVASAYAGWSGSLPADVVSQRLEQAMALSELPPEAFAGTLLPTMFSASTPPEVVEAFGASIRAFHPAGFRAMARASAGSVRDVLPGIRVPALLVHGDQDIRAPRRVADDLHRSIAGSSLVVLAGAGHACNIEAPEAFNRAVRGFLSA